MSFGGISTVSTGDLNGDGLFELVVGKTNGRIAMALNTGTKTEPKFGAPVELKGTAGTPPFEVPSGWEIDYGIEPRKLFRLHEYRQGCGRQRCAARGRSVLPEGGLCSLAKQDHACAVGLYPGFSRFRYEGTQVWLVA